MAAESSSATTGGSQPVTARTAFEGYDVVGDVHGHADKLEGLLDQMGYSFGTGVWRHPSRQVIFVGDLIDRGPAQVRTIDVARAMVDAGAAQMVLGNHEFNAIAWVTPEPDLPGEYLRRHSAKNLHQHEAFLDQVGADSDRHREYLDWFGSLPLWLDLGGLRVVHACWDVEAMETVAGLLDADGSLTEAVMTDGSRRGTVVYDAIETLLKGPEIDLPDGYSYVDHAGQCRDRARMRWWDADVRTLRDAAEIPDGANDCAGKALRTLPDSPLGEASVVSYTDDVPVVFGHYWRTLESPVTFPKTICVDYSVGGGGPLVAYRWSGGDFTPDNLEFYPPIPDDSIA